MKLTKNEIDTPLVTVIIPNYNNETYLPECLESVIKQSYKNMEIIVIDDGSTDRSAEILQKYWSEIKLIKSSHSGASVARNIGIEQSRGQFIAFMDSDDIWISEKIEKQMSKILNNCADLVYCGYQEIGLASRIVLPNSHFKGDCYEFFKNYPGVSFLACGGVLIRKSILSKSGLFDKNFKGAAEDWDFLRRICMNGKVDFSDEVLFYYRRHSTSITGRSTWEYYQGNKMAVINMLREDLQIKSVERRKIWFKLHWMFFKSFILKKKLFQAAFMFLQIFLPIKHRRMS
jgi:glycosyltransferase involved in cell wall biosynthesis